MKTWKKICAGSAIGIAIGGSIYCGNKLMSDRPVEASTAIETATDAVMDVAMDVSNTDDIGATVDDIVVAVDTTEEPEPEIAEDDKKDDTKSDDKKSDSKSDDKKDDTKVDNKKEPTSNVESSKPAVTEEPKPAKPSTSEAPKQPTVTEEPKPMKPATTETPKPTKPAVTEEPKPAKPTTPEAPKHTHDYSKWVVDVPASTKTVVDKEAWTETVEHDAKYKSVDGVQCHSCGGQYTSMDAYFSHPCGDAGYTSCYVQIKTAEAWTETINHPAETHEETVPEQGHWECSCGARK